MKNGYITSGGNITNIGTMKAIVYGVGYRVLKLCDCAGIDNVAFVVDGDETKWGSYVRIGDKIIPIQSPRILLSLKSEDYYVCLSTENHNDEIKNYVHKVLKKQFLIVESDKDIIWTYESLRSIIHYDCYVVEKLLNLNLLSNIRKYCNSIQREMKRMNLTGISYEPIKQGHKLCIKVDCRIQQLVISISTNKSALSSYYWHEGLGDVTKRRELYEAYSQIPQMAEITYYVDEHGLLIQKFCGEKKNFKLDEVRKKVLKKLRELNYLDYKINIYADPFKRFEELFLGLDSDKKLMVQEVYDNVMLFKKDFIDCPFVLSHGDFHPGNIVFDKEDCYFIDWDSLCMTYKYYDMCRFLYYSQIDEKSIDCEKYRVEILQIYNDMSYYMEVYNKKGNVWLCKKMMFLCESIEVLLRLYRNQKNTGIIIEIVKDHARLIEKEIRK